MIHLTATCRFAVNGSNRLITCRLSQLSVLWSDALNVMQQMKIKNKNVERGEGGVSEWVGRSGSVVLLLMSSDVGGRNILGTG